MMMYVDNLFINHGKVNVIPHSGDGLCHGECF
jgi:hypothetical protein